MYVCKCTLAHIIVSVISKREGARLRVAPPAKACLRGVVIMLNKFDRAFAAQGSQEVRYASQLEISSMILYWFVKRLTHRHPASPAVRGRTHRCYHKFTGLRRQTLVIVHLYMRRQEYKSVNTRTHPDTWNNAQLNLIRKTYTQMITLSKRKHAYTDANGYIHWRVHTIINVRTPYARIHRPTHVYVS